MGRQAATCIPALEQDQVRAGGDGGEFQYPVFSAFFTEMFMDETSFLHPSPCLSSTKRCSGHAKAPTTGDPACADVLAASKHCRSETASSCRRANTAAASRRCIFPAQPTDPSSRGLNLLP